MTAEGNAGGARRFLFSAQGWPYLLTPFIPAAVALELAHADAVIVSSSPRSGSSRRRR